MKIDLEKGKFQVGLGALGSAAGIGYAIVNKTGFWKGVGCWILFGMIGAGVGFAVDTLTKKEENK